MNGRNCFTEMFRINHLIVEEGLEDSLIFKNIHCAFPKLQPEFFNADVISVLEKDKNSLVVMNNRGRFLKSCPGTKAYLCCMYNFLNIGLNCPFNCTYCILQGYLNTNAYVVYANYKKMLEELTSILETDASIIRIGTGELTDSLALDRVVGMNSILIDFFSTQKQAYLELKTKSCDVGHLLNLNHRGRTIISWSLNPQCIIDREEGTSSSLESRLKAARNCQENGYKIGFHFDPIFLFKDWESEYEELIDKVFTILDKKSIIWISMGCFRFIPHLKSIIHKRFPESRIIYEEFIPGLDKKMRYPQPLRIKIYSNMASWIRKRDPDAFIYLCMESKDVWNASLGIAPESNEILKSWLDKRCNI